MLHVGQGLVRYPERPLSTDSFSGGCRGDCCQWHGGRPLGCPTRHKQRPPRRRTSCPTPVAPSSHSLRRAECKKSKARHLLKEVLHPIKGPPGDGSIQRPIRIERVTGSHTPAGQVSLISHRRLRSNTVARERARHWECIHTTHRTSKRNEGPCFGSACPSPCPYNLPSQIYNGREYDTRNGQGKPG